jgi:hypothetical protein
MKINEQEIRNKFIEYLKNNLGYTQENLLIEKRIDNKIIDLLIIDPASIEISYKALVEFKSITGDRDSAEAQVIKYKELLGINNLPCFLVYSEEIYVLQTYGWQLISLQDFPNLEKLK